MSPGPSSIGFWVGTYTTPASHVPGACGRGILLGNLNLGTGEIGLTIAAPKAADASYLALAGDRLFAVAESPGVEGSFCVYRIDERGALELEVSQGSGGSHPCHLAVVGGEVVLAHYMGDRLQIFRRARGGGNRWERREGSPCRGAGPVVSRQESPHLHQVVHLADLGHVAVCDLGSDRIWFHRVGRAGVEAIPFDMVDTLPGTGPRHLVYAPEVGGLYVLGELSGKILHYRRAGEGWKLEAEWPTVQVRAGGAAGAAIKLHPSGKALYVSERSSSQVYVFAMDSGTGELAPAGAVPSGGKGPRDFGIDPTGEWLICLNQDSDSIATFRLDPSNGLFMGETGPVVDCGSPVCLVFDEVVDSGDKLC